MINENNLKDTEELEKKLLKKSNIVWDKIDESEKEKLFEFANRYKCFLDKSKTEREAVSVINEMAIDAGFKNIDDIKKIPKSGKVYKIFRNKVIALAIVGKEPLHSGVHIIGSHIDSPRLDLKQNPLYEDVDLAFLKTHYYGGIRKYHWLVRPLAIHGRIVKKNGDYLDITIGERVDDPVFTISDLLPHLARKKQANKKLVDVFEGEKLNLLVGSMPLGGEKTKERFKLFVLNYLHENYSIEEEDFISAELEIVPAGKARDIGFDRSLVGSYGQDDRICAYTSLRAILDVDKPDATAVALFFDKEEIGSDGNTGAKSHFIKEFLSDIMVMADSNTNDRLLRKCLINSKALSGDVNGALDPDYQDVHEKRNAAKMGYGICMTKFTGSGGKSGASDANAEYVGEIRKLFNDNNIVWQTGELGKVDEGGGGTIAKFLAEYGMEIIDCGPAILSMHSPFEISSKADIYMSYKAYKAFYEKM